MSDLQPAIKTRTVLDSRSRWGSLHVRELWQARNLLFHLTLRDIVIRYRQAVLGILWAIIQPLFSILLFSVVFGHLAGISSDGSPYPLFLFSALLPWQLFANALQRSSNSLVDHANLITKVYFPRLVVPLSATIAPLVDFLIALLLLLPLGAYYGYFPSVSALFLPLFILLTLAAAFGLGLWLSALNVQFRDVRHALPFVIQLLMFASPVIYSVQLIPEGPWRILFSLNPMTGAIEGFRWSILGTHPPSLESLTCSAGVTVILLITGWDYFRRTERSFADVV